MRRPAKPITRREIAAKPRTLREQYEVANAADRHYAILSGKPAAFQTEIAAKRIVVNRTPDDMLEASVSKDTASVLASHPQVLFAVRQNSGGTWLPGKDGKDQPVFFYRLLRNEDMVISDYWAILKDGRMLACECKRRDWKFTNTDRERRQLNFIDMVVRSGGLGLFVTDARQITAKLEEK